MVVRRDPLSDNVEIAGSTGGRNTLIIVFGDNEGSSYVVSGISEEFMDEVDDYETPLSDLISAWAGARYYVVDEQQPHVDNWIEL